ncbi:VWA domain-containing protein [bacterium]|nr:MAG: VWA domain-containing protein [bacterium]
MKIRYSSYIPSPDHNKTPFQKLKDIFDQLLLISGGDVSQALKWLNELDRQYNLIKPEDEYSMAQFIEDLKEQGFIEFDDEQNRMILTAKTEVNLRKNAFEEIFKNLKKGTVGEHKTDFTGRGMERQPETRAFQFGDDLTQLDTTASVLNVLKHSNLEAFDMQEDDLMMHETDHYTGVATVLMIDLSHSMILYGEDRITPAKKVALALSELILKNFAKDSLDIIAFGDDAWQVSIKDLPYLQVGPFHTNTKAGLEMARNLLSRKKHSNKQIFMITDGKPSAMFEYGKLYKNSYGLDRKIVNKVLDEAVKCRREKIEITTFMIAQDPYLQNFVHELTEANGGKAYFTGIDNLGGVVFQDYIKNRKKRV